MSKETNRVRLQLMTGLLRQLHLERMLERFNPQLVLATFNLVNASVSIALLAMVALLTQETFVFPSLGATAFLLFYVPLSAAASPRNTLCAHFVGALAGWLSLAAFGLLDAAPALIAGVDLARVAAAATSLGATCFLMVLLRIAHPPAAATTLIVSLGMMPRIEQIPVLMAAVLLLIGQAVVINRLAGVPYPIWSPRETDGQEKTRQL